MIYSMVPFPVTLSDR